MRLESGQMVLHQPTGSRWIVLNIENFDLPSEGYSWKIEALCIYTGRAGHYWAIHDVDTWLMGFADSLSRTPMWKVLNEL